MKIKFDEILANKKDWLHQELLASATNEVIDLAKEKAEYDVKLLINGIEVEPKLLTKIIENLDAYIANRAKNMLLTKLKDAENEVHELVEAISAAKSNIIDKFKL
jgi:Zn-dependent oligopeptidase